MDRPDWSLEEGWTRAVLVTCPREEYSSCTWQLEPLLERAGFAIREAEYGASRVYAAYVCSKG